MIATLPLLFANGHPVALSNITLDELEKFITFMVTCSWGHDTAKDIRQPPWWPQDVEFSHPFTRPAGKPLPADWTDRLRNLVRGCYDYHKSAFLLVFSGQLSRYPRTRLRYVDNLDHTTSLYYLPSGRLLVTFRNENLHYDKNTSSIEDVKVVDVFKSTDIYLCDNCDSHFDNLDALKAHERLCNDETPSSSSTCNGGLPDFLSALKLQPVGVKVKVEKAPYDNSEIKPRNVRSVANIDRGPPYPFSSLAYTKNVKPVQRDTTYIRERIERHCCTSTISAKSVNNKQFPVRYRRPIDYWHRRHVFPHQRKKEILDLKAQLLYLKCRPITVNMERMSLASMQEYMDMLKKEAEERREREEKDIVVLDGGDEDEEFNDTEMKSTDPLCRENECEVIDLCSDEESSEVGGYNENVDPRAGVACVMRGGAVLRRTAAAAPRALPAAPCGARHRPLHHHPPPHPVILIAHTLNNLQTISLE